MTNDEKIFSVKVTQSLNDFITERLGKRQTKVAQQAMRVVVDATTYNQDNTAELNRIRAMIGISKNTFYNFDRADEGKYQHKK